MHALESTELWALGRSSMAQGDLKMIALTPGSAETRCTVFTASLWSNGFTVSTTLSPMPRSTDSMLTGCTDSPIMVRPVPGCG